MDIDQYLRLADSSGNLGRVLGRASADNRIYFGDVDASGSSIVFRVNGQNKALIQDSQFGIADRLRVGNKFNTIASEYSVFVDAVADNVGVAVRGEAEQTADLQQWLASGNTELASISASGQAYFADSVGIGTTAPSSNLQIANNLATGALNNFSEYQLLLYQGDQPAASSYGLGVRSDTLAFNTGRDFDFDQSGTTVMTINSGNVGIGISNPSSNLQIANNAATGALDNFSEYQLLLYQNATAASSYGLGVKSGTLAFNTNKDFDFDQSGTTVMTIKNSGNVGIGTTSPAQKLTLQGGNILNTADSSTLADGGSLDSGDMTLQGYYDSDGTTDINPAARTMNLRTIVDASGNERLAVLNDADNEFVTFDGNNRRVGIGTTTPDGIFMVNGYQGGTYGFTMRHRGSATTFRGASSATEGSYFHIEHGGSNQTTIKGGELYIDNVDRITGRGGLELATASGGGHYKMNLIVDGVSSLFLDGGNNSRFVGIGTTNPGARLQVNTKGGGKVGQIIKGADSQSADLLQAKDSNGTVLASIDASGNLSVKNATVNSTLTVNGVAVVDGVQTSIATKTVDYTVTDSDSTILADASGGAITVTLPTATGREGREFTIKKIDGSANNVVLATDGAETIDGSSSKSISSENHYLQVVSNGSNWFVIGIAPSL